MDDFRINAAILLREILEESGYVPHEHTEDCVICQNCGGCFDNLSVEEMCEECGIVY